MPRPTNKDELIKTADDQFTKLWKLIDSMSDELQTMEFGFEDRDRNLRDVLVHLHEWHNMTRDWHRIGVLENGMPAVPGEGYTWKTLPDMNVKIWERCQGTSLDDAKDMVKKSHDAVMELVEPHTDAELFTKGLYKWTKTSNLGAYFIGSTSSHYEWAMKKIKRHLKTAQ